MLAKSGTENKTKIMALNFTVCKISAMMTVTSSKVYEGEQSIFEQIKKKKKRKANLYSKYL